MRIISFFRLSSRKNRKNFQNIFLLILFLTLLYLFLLYLNYICYLLFDVWMFVSRFNFARFVFLNLFNLYESLVIVFRERRYRFSRYEIPYYFPRHQKSRRGRTKGNTSGYSFILSGVFFPALFRDNRLLV